MDRRCDRDRAPIPPRVTRKRATPEPRRPRQRSLDYHSATSLRRGAVPTHDVATTSIHLTPQRAAQPRVVTIPSEALVSQQLAGPHTELDRLLQPPHRLPVVAHAGVRARHAARAALPKARIQLDRPLIRRRGLAMPLRVQQHVAHREPVRARAIVDQQRLAPELRRLVPVAVARGVPCAP